MIARLLCRLGMHEPVNLIVQKNVRPFGLRLSRTVVCLRCGKVLP